MSLILNIYINTVFQQNHTTSERNWGCEIENATNQKTWPDTF